MLDYEYNTLEDLNIDDFTERINQRIRFFEAASGKTFQMENETFRDEVMSMFAHLNLLITRFQNNRKLFLNAIAASQKTTVDPTILPRELFRSELQKIKSSIVGQGQLGLHLPLTTETLPGFYKLATSESQFIDNFLIITVSILLASVARLFFHF